MRMLRGLSKVFGYLFLRLVEKRHANVDGSLRSDRVGRETFPVSPLTSAETRNINISNPSYSSCKDEIKYLIYATK
jgi:hypothetical protein